MASYLKRHRSLKDAGTASALCLTELLASVQEEVLAPTTCSKAQSFSPHIKQVGKLYFAHLTLCILDPGLGGVFVRFAGIWGTCWMPVVALSSVKGGAGKTSALL